MMACVPAAATQMLVTRLQQVSQTGWQRISQPPPRVPADHLAYVPGCWAEGPHCGQDTSSSPESSPNFQASHSVLGPHCSHACSLRGTMQELQPHGSLLAGPWGLTWAVWQRAGQSGWQDLGTGWWQGSAPPRAPLPAALTKPGPSAAPHLAACPAPTPLTHMCVCVCPMASATRLTSAAQSGSDQSGHEIHDQV